MSDDEIGPGEWVTLDDWDEQRKFFDNLWRTGMSTGYKTQHEANEALKLAQVRHQAQEAMAYGEQGADTDGTAKESVFWLDADGLIADLQARIASRDKTIDALTRQIIGMDATMAGLRTEAKRLSELAQDLQAQLSARHGAAGDPQTGAAPSPDETPRANPFRHGWATNWKMR